MPYIERSCHHGVDASFKSQVGRLGRAGYPETLLVAVAEDIYRAQRHERRAADNGVQESTGRREKVAVIPYKHQLSHRLKKVGRHAGVHVVFSAPHKLA